MVPDAWPVVVKAVVVVIVVVVEVVEVVVVVVVIMVVVVEVVIVVVVLTLVINILKQENIKSEPKAVAELINAHFPDWRRVLNELQRYSTSGQIDAGILVNISNENVKELMSFLKAKEFTHVRKWIVNNLDNDATRIIRTIYDSLYENIDHSTIPHATLILADYQYKSAFAADQEINLLACMTELMSQVKFK